MTRKRIPSEDRKVLILDAARRVFSQRGFDAAKTLEIARAANVSEALVYRHYPSKLSLYRAVLRSLIRDQDENTTRLGLPEPTTRGLVLALRTYINFIVSTNPEEEKTRQNFRLLLASLAGDGSYASLVYSRSQRLMMPSIRAAIQFARDNGDIVGMELAAENTSMFIEHVGLMLNTIASLAPARWPYASRGEDLARQAVWFCCRGIGMTDAAIARHIDS